MPTVLIIGAGPSYVLQFVLIVVNLSTTAKGESVPSNNSRGRVLKSSRMMHEVYRVAFGEI